MQSLHHPAAGPLERVRRAGMGTVLPARADVGCIAPLFGGEARQIVVVARIQTQVLRPRATATSTNAAIDELRKRTAG